jgi:uncharacterized protein (DUF433 family)
MPESAPAYVDKTPEGGWRIHGTRVSLDSIVHAYWEGRLPEVVLADFPSLTLEKVHGAIAFYLRNRDEIDAYLKLKDERWCQLEATSVSKHAALIQRVRQAREVPSRLEP